MLFRVGTVAFSFSKLSEIISNDWKRKVGPGSEQKKNDCH